MADVEGLIPRLGREPRNLASRCGCSASSIGRDQDIHLKQSPAGSPSYQYCRSLYNSQKAGPQYLCCRIQIPRTSVVPRSAPSPIHHRPTASTWPAATTTHPPASPRSKPQTRAWATGEEPHDPRGWPHVSWKEEVKGMCARSNR